MSQQAFADFNNHDFIYSLPAHSNLPFVTPTGNQNLASLKTKIDEFFKQHPTIVNDVKNHFYDDLIFYMLGRIFDPSFTKNDINQTNRLINKFFNKHEKHIEIMFDYFFDDLKPFILKRNFPDWEFLHPFADLIPKSYAREHTINSLKKSGASFLTSLMYSNQNKNFSERQSLARYSFLRKIIFCVVLAYFFSLRIIFGSEIFYFTLCYSLVFTCILFALYLFGKF